MAQVDTGLGWEAKDSWLIRSGSATIANVQSIGGSLYPGQPIATNITTAPDCLARGLKVDRRVRYGSGDTCYASANDAPILIFATISGNDTTYRAVAATRSARVARMDSGSFTSEIPGSDGNWSLDQSTGLFTYTVGVHNTGQGYYVSYDNCPVFSSTRDALDAISVVNAAIDKVNDGYAVGCVAKWKTSGNVVIESPILISSNSSFVDMSTTEQWYMAKYNQQYDGIRFYMAFYQNIDAPVTSILPRFDISGPDDPYATLDELFRLICAPDQANIKIIETADPYDPFGNSEEGGGPVDPDPEDDDISEPSLPSMSFHNTGLCRIYRADDIALRQLANYMWTDDTFLQTLINHAIQLIENPMDAIISLNMVPVAPPDLLVGTAEAVKVMFIPTPAAMWPVLNQFVRIDCGSLQLNGTYGSALDYNPYTKVSCFLPYVGFVDLDTDEVMGKTLSVVYRIDVVTGVCVAMIKVDGDVLYQFSGHCSIQMPLSSADFSGYFGALVEAGKLIAGTAAMAAGAPVVGGMLLDAPAVPEGGGTTTHKTIKTRNENTNRMRKAAEVTETTERKPAKLSLGELARRQTANTVGAVMNSKYSIEHSGGFSGNSGYMGVRRPFIIVKRPNIANPEQYGQLNGRPSMIYLNLGTCTGYTEVQSVQLTGIAATNPELSEISTLLKSGVIF